MLLKTRKKSYRARRNDRAVLPFKIKSSAEVLHEFLDTLPENFAELTPDEILASMRFDGEIAKQGKSLGEVTGVTDEEVKAAERYLFG
ncbi:hypothetical protein FACS1894217_01090 [Clostridia bacterium]|nr:hypothetical protein FACS1894217_01090 [Clostridia bacterium]